MPLVQPIDPNWPPAEPVPKFSEAYVAVASARYPVHDASPAKVPSRTASPRRCALCHRTGEQRASFRSVSHIVPAALGNRRYFSNEECDDCNSHFDKNQDNELANFLAVQRLLYGVRGRGGLISLSPHGQNGSRVVSRGPLQIEIWREEGDVAVDFEIRDGNHGRMAFEMPSYRPLRALQALLRSSWLLMDEAARTRAPHLLEWITRDPPTPTFCLRYTLRNAAFQFVELNLWERRSQISSADLILQFMFCDVVLIWPLPAPDGRQVASVLPPFWMNQNQSPDCALLRMDSPNARASSVRADWAFTFDGRVRTSPESKPTTPSWSKTPPANGEVCVCVEQDGVITHAIPATLTLTHQDAFVTRFKVGGRSFAGMCDATVDSRLQEARLNVKLLPHIVSAHDAAKTVDLVLDASAGASVSFRKTKDSPPFARGYLHGDAALQELRLLLGALAVVNNACDVDIRFPASDSDFDWERVLETAHIIETGKLELGSGTLDAMPEDPKVFQNLGPEVSGSRSLIVEEEDVSVVIGAVKLSLGPRKTTFSLDQPLANASRLEGNRWTLAFSSATVQYPRWPKPKGNDSHG